QRLVQRRGVAQVGRLQRHRHHRTRIQIDRVLGLVRQVRPPVLHLRNPRIPVRRALPLLIRHPLLPLAVQPCQVFPARRLYARSLRQTTQKLLIAFPCVAAHNRAHRRIRLQRGRINGDPLPLHQPTIGQHPQHPAEHFAMRFHVDQTAGTRNRCVIRCVLLQRYPHKAPQPQRIRQLPGNPALTVDALKVSQQQRPEVDPRGQRRSTILSRIELRTPSLHKLIELLRLQQFIEPLIERMSWRRGQLRMSNPNVFLLFPLLARPHRHTRILRSLPVDPSNSFAYASGLTPRAVKGHVSHWDKNGILNILERSDDADLNYLFGPGGVAHSELITKLDSWKEEVQRFYKRRYQGVDIYKVKDFSTLKAQSLGPIQPGDEIPQEDSDDLVNPLGGTKRRTKNQPVQPAESDKWVNELYGSYLPKDKAGGHFIQQNVDVNVAKDKGEDDTADAQFSGALLPHCRKEKQYYTSQKKKENGGKPLSQTDKEEIDSRFQYCVSSPTVAGFYESPEEAGEKKGQIWVHSGRETATTRLHESLHAYADPSVTSALPHFASEGMTEYFTRQIALRKNLAISPSYEGPFLAIQEFAV